MKITKLNRRHSGYGLFICYIESDALGEKIETFIEWREWCWVNFGPGIERDFMNDQMGYTWAWAIKDTGYGRYYRIYFRTNKELNWFKMKWL